MRRLRLRRHAALVAARLPDVLGNELGAGVVEPVQPCPAEASVIEG